jgi:hypothetical protein
MGQQSRMESLEQFVSALVTRQLTELTLKIDDLKWNFKLFFFK